MSDEMREIISLLEHHQVLANTHGHHQAYDYLRVIIKEVRDRDRARIIDLLKEHGEDMESPTLAWVKRAVKGTLK